MQKRIAKERLIFRSNSYDFDEMKEEYASENDMDIEDVCDKDVWNEIYANEEADYELEKERLDEVFHAWKGHFIAVGTCGLWTGNFEGGFLFTDFDDLARQMFKDCEYFHFWDENGHLFISASHHDGTHLVEIKQLTDAGEIYYDNWENNWNDKRTMRYIYQHLFTNSKYSKLIHFAHRYYGCPQIEYEKGVAV